MGKEEIARNEQFLLFPQCFLLNQKLVSLFVNIFDIVSLFAAELEEPTIGISSKGLRKCLFWPSMVCTYCSLTWIQMFCKCINPLLHTPILGFSNYAANKDMMSKNMDKLATVIWLSRKHCGKRRNCSFQAISSFPTMFSKAVCFWCVKMSIYGVKG